MLRARVPITFRNGLVFSIYNLKISNNFSVLHRKLYWNLQFELQQAIIDQFLYET